jgi:hypothetical protein
MFDRIRRQIPAIRATEYAHIARWFSPSPLGLLFHGNDGTARPIAPVQAEVRRAEAERVVDAYLERLPDQGPLFVGMILGATILAWCIADLFGVFGLTKTGAIPIGFAIGAAGAHAIEFHAVYTMRQQLYVIRAAIANELRATAPVPTAIGEKYRRRNPFQTALQFLVAVILVFAMLAMHDESLMMAVPPLVYFAVVPLAWLLFALSKYRDAKSGATRRRLI